MEDIYLASDSRQDKFVKKIAKRRDSTVNGLKQDDSLKQNDSKTNKLTTLGTNHPCKVKLCVSDLRFYVFTSL